MPAKKDPDRQEHDAQVAKFWSESYEAALYHYSRDPLSCSIYQRFEHLDGLVAQVQQEDRFALKFVLNRNGELQRYAITETSYVTEFDHRSEESFLEARHDFTALPAGSAEYTSFELNIGPASFSVVPLLWQEQRQLLFELRRVLRRFDNSSKETLKLMLRPSVVIVESAIDEHSEITDKIVRAIEQSDYAYPLDFPEEIRFIYDPTRGGLYAFSPELLSEQDNDRFDRLCAERRQKAFERVNSDKLAREFATLATNPSDLNALREAASLSMDSNQFDAAMNYCDEIIRLAPKLPDGFLLKGDLIMRYARLLSGNSQERYYQLTAEFADRMLYNYERALDKVPKREPRLRENVCLAICLTLASAGRYEQFIEASKRLKENFNISLARRRMANWFELRQAWKEAIREWDQALKYAEPPLRSKIEKSKRYCEERLMSD